MRRTRLARTAVALTGALAGALAVVVGPSTAAQAADECTARTTTKAFAAFGDNNDYFPISGGTFESGSLSAFTTTGGVSVAGENEPWKVLGSSHSRSAALPPGATLKATFCVQINEDSMRLFTKSPSNSGSGLTIKATVATAYGSAAASISVSGSTSSAWAPTPSIPLKNVSGPDGKQYVTLLITNNGSGTWLVDDILVDPWKTR
jgi:hypothetical protein